MFFRNSWSAEIIDISIVADHNINKGYIHKINAYTTLSQQLCDKLKIKGTKIIPVIATINGLIRCAKKFDAQSRQKQ